MGIYSSVADWAQVINNDEFAQYPLWYAHYDNQANFSDLSPYGTFGGWTQPVMKQYAGNTDGGLFDFDWSPMMPSIPLTVVGQNGTAPASGSASVPSSPTASSASAVNILQSPPVARASAWRPVPHDETASAPTNRRNRKRRTEAVKRRKGSPMGSNRSLKPRV